MLTAGYSEGGQYACKKRKWSIIGNITGRHRDDSRGFAAEIYSSVGDTQEGGCCFGGNSGPFNVERGVRDVWVVRGRIRFVEIRDATLWPAWAEGNAPQKIPTTLGGVYIQPVVGNISLTFLHNSTKDRSGCY